MLLMNGTNQQSVLQDLLRYQEIQNGKDSGYPLPTKNELAHRALFAAEINAQVEGNQKKVLDSIGQEHRRGQGMSSGGHLYLPWLVVSMGIASVPSDISNSA
jgi:hypothetical protein